MSRHTSARSRRVAGLLVALAVVAAGFAPFAAQTTAAQTGAVGSDAPPTRVANHTDPASATASSRPAASTSATPSTAAGSSAASLAGSTDARRQVGGGAVTSGGVSTMNLTAAHESGYTGEGQTVVIIDDGFDTTNPEIADQVAETRDFTGKGIGKGESGLHGTAVAEVVADTAPDARIVLVRANTETQLYDAIDYIRQDVDADVVSLSRNWRHAGSLDGDSRMDEAINASVSDGTTWLVSAGNSGDGKHWSGTWRDPDGDGWLNFAGDRETSGVILPEPHDERHSDVSLSLQWNQWPRTASDYDLYLLNTTSMECTDEAGRPTFCRQNVVGSSTIRQTGNQEPWELVSDHWVNAFSASSYANGEGPEFQIAIYAHDAEEGARFDLFAGDDHRLTDDATPSGSIMLPAANPNVITVGATGAEGDSVAPYSSRGSADDGRVKPNVVAPGGVQTSAVDQFSGTSAATPHAAGVAAVLLDADDSLSPDEVRTLLEENAAPVRGDEPNTASGHGLIDAGASLAALDATGSGADAGATTTSEPEPSSTPTATETPATTTAEPTSEAPTTTVTAEPTATATAEPTATATAEPTATATAEPTSATAEPEPSSTPTGDAAPETSDSPPAESTAEPTTTASLDGAESPRAGSDGDGGDGGDDDANNDAGADDGGNGDAGAGGNDGGSADPDVSQDGGLGIRSVDAPSTAVVGTEVAIPVTLSNTDVVSHTRTVQLRVDGTVVGERRVALDSGERTTIRFSHAFRTEGDRRLAVGAQERTVSVESPEDATSGDSTEAGGARNEAIGAETVTAASGGGAAETAAPSGGAEGTTAGTNTSASRIPGFSALTALAALATLAAALVLFRRRS